jgi:hypothetical protein
VPTPLALDGAEGTAVRVAALAGVLDLDVLEGIDAPPVADRPELLI